jgi:hypothetical protein
MTKPRGYAAEDILDEQGFSKKDKSLPVTIGVSVRPEWNEYVVFWKEGNKILDGPSAHIDRGHTKEDRYNAIEEVRMTLQDKFEWARKNGFNVRISPSKLTQGFLPSNYNLVDTKIKEIPYYMSDSQAAEFAEEARECRETPHMRQQRLYGVG